MDAIWTSPRVIRRLRPAVIPVRSNRLPVQHAYFCCQQYNNLRDRPFKLVMIFDSALVSSLLFAFAVLADRRREIRQSRLLNRVQQSTNTASDGVEYSPNWAGALWDEDNGTFTAITGTFTVPVPLGPSGSAAAVWVGIDGDTCNSGILQTGVEFTVTNDGPSYKAWYEWYPDWAYYFDDLSVHAGDVIRLTVSTSSAMSGTAMVENLSTGKHDVQQINSTFALCGQNAEWIVEDFEDGIGNQVPFANFSTVTFTDALATGTGVYTPDGATIVDIQQNNQTLTSVMINGSSVTINYV